VEATNRLSFGRMSWTEVVRMRTNLPEQDLGGGDDDDDSLDCWVSAIRMAPRYNSEAST